MYYIHIFTTLTTIIMACDNHEDLTIENSLLQNFEKHSLTNPEANVTNQSEDLKSIGSEAKITARRSAGDSFKFDGNTHTYKEMQDGIGAFKCSSSTAVTDDCDDFTSLEQHNEKIRKLNHPINSLRNVNYLVNHFENLIAKNKEEYEQSRIFSNSLTNINTTVGLRNVSEEANQKILAVPACSDLSDNEDEIFSCELEEENGTNVNE